MAVLPISMDQNCNLELRLSPSTTSFSQPHLHHFLADQSTKQQMTIFYNGRVCVADFTEDQARAIIMLATRQMEERSISRPQKSEPSLSSSSQEQGNGEAGSGSGLSVNRSSELSPSSSVPEQCNGEASSGLSMKRSLQRFLQKRKNRIQSASPYHR